MDPRLRGDDGFIAAGMTALQVVHRFLPSASCSLPNYLDVSGGTAEVSRALRLAESP
jgi:hypothetical protein